MKNYRHSGFNGVPMAFMCDERVRPVNGVLQRDDNYYMNEYQDTNDDNDEVEFSISFSSAQDINELNINAGPLHINISVSRS